MYVIEYWLHCDDDAMKEEKETFSCSQVEDFFDRVKQLRTIGIAITTYFID